MLEKKLVKPKEGEVYALKIPTNIFDFELSNNYYLNSKLENKSVITSYIMYEINLSFRLIPSFVVKYNRLFNLFNSPTYYTIWFKILFNNLPLFHVKF